MKILFPLTNPICFDDTVLYQSYQDARNYQYIAPFQQKYKLTDRLTFQLKWKEKDYGIYYIKIYLVINGVSTFYRQRKEFTLKIRIISMECRKPTACSGILNKK